MAQHGPDEKAMPRKNPFAALREQLGGSLPRGPQEAAPQDELERAPAEAARERVIVRLERKGRGGKTVTLAEGPGLTRRRVEELAREARRALGLGARVEDGALVLQGDQRERLVAWLEKRGFTRVDRGN